MNRLTKEKRVQVLACIVEGNSIRSTVRITGVAKNTVAKLIVDAGNACAAYQDKTLRNLSCKRLQVDEIWSFCYAKQKNVPEHKRGWFGYGDVWTWTALCADTKLVPCWLVGARNGKTAKEFLGDLAARLSGRVQLTSDGQKIYVTAVPDAFGQKVDYAQLEKYYGSPPEKKGPRKYSPAICLGTRKTYRIGNPDPKHVSTSYVERQNLTMRMSMRRFTRLTNAFSKKVENHACAVALHFMYYNFCRIHQSLRVTPAMEAGVTDRLWGIEDIVRLLGR